MKATKSTIEHKAFVAHQKDRALEQKYQTPDNYWCDWFEKGYREAETEAEERHAKKLQELKDRAVEAFCSRCQCLNACPSRQCEVLDSFTQKLNEL